jgi:hypothetical protein
MIADRRAITLISNQLPRAHCALAANEGQSGGPNATTFHAKRPDRLMTMKA